LMMIGESAHKREHLVPTFKVRVKEQYLSELNQPQPLGHKHAMAVWAIQT